MEAERLADQDVNLHMIDRGLAWHYRRYGDKKSDGPGGVLGL